MEWLSVNERKWEHYYDEAKRYYLSHGDLEVPPSYRSESGVWLGKWIARLRKNKNNLKTAGVNGNQVLRLEQIGMQWNEEEDFRLSKTKVRKPIAV